MELRDELCPPKVDENLVEALVDLIKRIEQDVEFESDEQLELIDEFNRRAQANWPPTSFYEIDGAMDVDEAVRCELVTPAPRLDITDEEYIEVIRRIMNAEGDEHELSFWMNLLERNLVHPGVSDLIYWSDLETPAAVLEEARKYKPIQL